jgi:hypothetical protein
LSAVRAGQEESKGFAFQKVRRPRDCVDAALWTFNKIAKAQPLLFTK